MGDSVIYQVYTKTTTGVVSGFGPSVYSHDGGQDVPRVLKEMMYYVEDVPELSQASDATGALVHFVRKVKPRERRVDISISNASRLLTRDHSPGGAGVVLLHLEHSAAGNKLHVEFMGGYLEDPATYKKLERNYKLSKLEELKCWDTRYYDTYSSEDNEREVEVWCDKWVLRTRTITIHDACEVYEVKSSKSSRGGPDAPARAWLVGDSIEDIMRDTGCSVVDFSRRSKA